MEIWIHNCRVQLFSKQQIQELRMCSQPLTFYLRLDYDSWIKQVSKGLSSIVVLWLHLQLLKYWIMCTYTFLQGWSPYRLEELGMTFGEHIKHPARSQAYLQSSELLSLESTGLWRPLKVFATRRFPPKPWTEFNRVTEQERDFCNSTEVSSNPGTMNLCYVHLKMKL